MILKRRARRILALSRAVAERPKLVFNESVPFFGFDTAGKSIGIKRRSAGQRKYGAVVNIQRNDGALFALERFVSGVLQSGGPRSDEPCSRARR